MESVSLNGDYLEKNHEVYQLPLSIYNVILHICVFIYEDIIKVPVI